MDDSGRENGGVSMVMGPPCELFADVESEHEASESEKNFEEGLAFRFGCDCGFRVVSFGCPCQPCEKDSNARGVPSQISGDLGCPVRGKEKIVSGTFAAPNDNRIAI